MNSGKFPWDANGNFVSDLHISHLLLEGHSAVMLLIDPRSWVVVDANQAAVDFYGYPKSKLCGTTVAEIHVLPWDRVVSEYQKALNRRGNHLILSHKLSNGKERVVEIYSDPIEAQGKTLLFSIIHDITQRQLEEEKLTIERKLLGTLLDNLPDLIYVKDMEGRKIISNTADWQAAGGKSVDDVLGKSDFDTYPPDLASKFWADDNSVLNLGIPVINREEPGFDSRGNLRWVLTTKVPLWDEDGHVTGLIGIGRDITKRKQMEEELNESKLLFHLLIESLPQNVYAKNFEGHFIFANQRYCKTQGKSLTEIIGKTDFDLHPRELAEKYRADDRRVIEKGEPIELVEEHQPIGEESFFVQVIKTPFYDSKGKIAGTLGIFWDITERRRAEIELRQTKEGLKMANIELQSALAREKQLARTDSLTGVNNRRYIFELAEYEFKVSTRYHLEFSVLMFDVDRFKEVNDMFGHPVGDQVLIRLAQVVRVEIRSTDILGRYGSGDEFIVLLPGTDANEAVQLAERIRSSVSLMRVETEKGTACVTISVGVAQTFHDELQPDTVENLLLRVDQALYSAKQRGRNCIMAFGER
jgi:diguanylate cyclase (GGDEF)-like protein/PAS domain S-box-containing protein